MFLQSLYLRNFRNYDEAHFDFSPQVNRICGPNAVGKTSLLEAIYFLMAGCSCRNASTFELIKHGADFFHIQACLVKHGVEQWLKIFFSRHKKKILYNETPLPSLSCLLGILKGCVLSPDDADLVKGPPLLRRQFLDMQIAQCDPLYVHYLTRYNQAIQQRNCLLKQKNLS